MPTVKEILTELKSKGSAQTRKTFCNHGAKEENLFGVKVGDLKPIAKKIKGQQSLALELFDTGNSDAQYLAGLVADGSQMKMSDLDRWVKAADWCMISEYSVPGVATEHPQARKVAMKWIKSKQESIAAAGWCTYSGIIATRAEEELDHAEIQSLLELIAEKIHTQPNRVRYTMNGFVISVGSYVPALSKSAKTVAKKIGKVSVDMGNTSCKVPLATEYIEKIEKMGRVGKKRKTMKC